jgi:hypothetical protein
MVNQGTQGVGHGTWERQDVNPVLKSTGMTKLQTANLTQAHYPQPAVDSWIWIIYYIIACRISGNATVLYRGPLHPVERTPVKD